MHDTFDRRGNHPPPPPPPPPYRQQLTTEIETGGDKEKEGKEERTQKGRDLRIGGVGGGGVVRWKGPSTKRKEGRAQAKKPQRGGAPLLSRRRGAAERGKKTEESARWDGDGGQKRGDLCKKHARTLQKKAGGARQTFLFFVPGSLEQTRAGRFVPKQKPARRPHTCAQRRTPKQKTRKTKRHNTHARSTPRDKKTSNRAASTVRSIDRLGAPLSGQTAAAACCCSILAALCVVHTAVEGRAGR